MSLSRNKKSCLVPVAGVIIRHATLHESEGILHRLAQVLTVSLVGATQTFHSVEIDATDHWAMCKFAAQHCTACRIDESFADCPGRPLDFGGSIRATEIDKPSLTHTLTLTTCRPHLLTPVVALLNGSAIWRQTSLIAQSDLPAPPQTPVPCPAAAPSCRLRWLAAALRSACRAPARVRRHPRRPLPPSLRGR